MSDPTWCPVHGSALCPEDYMLKSDGTPAPGYSEHWDESIRCGRRQEHPTIVELRADNERLRAALETAEPWLTYLLSHVAVDWAPNEEAVLRRDTTAVRSALSDTPQEDDHG